PEGGSISSSSSSNSLLSTSRCSCFTTTLPCLRSRKSSGLSFWQRIQSDHRHHWWARGLLKIREWSEIVAGPRWKTFIRRFNRTAGGNTATRQTKFQYDPLSYALNFDEGHLGNSDQADDDVAGYRDFSSRYASVSPSGKAL
ncbi:hypothetical protein CFOL_v3_06531, partial [Cephalotus follicularis]